MLRVRFAAAVLALALALALAASPAHAANILFVADGSADTGVADALTADGHTVTSRINDMDAAGSNASLRDAAALAEYDAIFWSVAGGSSYLHSDPEVFAALTEFVMGGGRVMIFGYDGTLGDTMLQQFIGGTGSRDQVGTPPGPIAMLETSVTVGVVDLRGLTPSDGYTDKDCVFGLSPETTLLVASGGDSSCAQWSLRRLGDGEVAWVSNGMYSGSHPSWTTVGSTFNGAIRNFAGAADSGSTEPGAPEIEFDRVYGADEGAEVTLSVTVTDPEGDPVTFSWDLNDDGTFGERAGETSYTIAAGTTDGDANIRLAVTASDGTHSSTRTRTLRIRNVAPRITSEPPTATSVGANIRYTIVTEDPAGDDDPLTYTLVTGPAGAAVTAEGVFVWNPTETDVTMADERIRVEVAVDDGDGGTASQSWEMTVSPNHAPTPVGLLYPANGIAIVDPTPRLVISNATDAEVLDTLSYYFELDDEDTFADPVIARGEMIEQGTGYTAYQITDPLPVGRYYWRAWSFDGSASSEPTTTSFFVVPDPDADAGTPLTLDAGLDAGMPAPPAPTDRGCSCAVPGAGGSRAPLASLAIASVAIAIARRRSTRR